MEVLELTKNKMTMVLGIVVVAMIVALVGACGGDDETTPAATARPAATAVPAATAMPEPTAVMEEEDDEAKKKRR